ncbi:MAG: RDD family protein [Pseudomonadota bacterium]
MTNGDPYHRLPDPARQAGFYEGVAVKRFIAFFLDLLIILVLSLVPVVATLGLGAFVFPLIFLVVGFLYRVLTLAAGSATWGMRLMAIELRRIDAEKFSMGDAAVHTLAFYFSFGVIPLQLISAVLMLTTARGQGLTDMLFGTVALNRRASA